MDIYINLESSKYLDAISLFVAYIALLIASMAYIWSVNRDFAALKALLVSFKNDLDYYDAWLGRDGYSQETYNVKNSFCPVKPIYPLSNDALTEIIRKGLDGLSKASPSFSSRLSIFNERIIAFNSSLDQLNWASSANPIATEKLQEKLVELGLRKTEDELSYNSFKESIEELKKDKVHQDLYYLATNIRRLNYNIHIDLISNKNHPDKLNYLYSEIKNELNSLLINFDRNKPKPIYYSPAILVITTMVFLYVVTMLFL